MTESNYIIVIQDVALEEVTTGQGKYTFVAVLKEQNGKFVTLYRRQS